MKETDRLIDETSVIVIMTHSAAVAADAADCGQSPFRVDRYYYIAPNAVFRE